MSLRSRIHQLAYDTAVHVARGVANARAQQLLQQQTGVGTVQKVEGNSVTIKLADGSEKTVINIGGRLFGKDAGVITDAQNFCL
jgi:hypothetical protein